jgi:hypothetical protein
MGKAAIRAAIADGSCNVTIRKSMSEMRIAVFASDLVTHHKQTAILVFHDIFGLKGCGEAGLLCTL